MPVVADTKVARNMLGATKDMAVLIVQAKRVRGRARTVYYKSAFLLISSVVEAMTYLLIKKKCRSDPTLISKWQYPTLKKVTELSDKEKLGTIKTLWIAEEMKTDFEPEKADFNSMIAFCKKVGILNSRHCSSLDSIRKKRNNIHLHTAESNSYTFSLIKKSSIILSKLFTVHSEN